MSLGSVIASFEETKHLLEAAIMRMDGRSEGRKPWSWASLPGLWVGGHGDPNEWDHGDDWAHFDATGGRMAVSISVEESGRPWLTSERLEDK